MSLRVSGDVREAVAAHMQKTGLSASASIRVLIMAGSAAMTRADVDQAVRVQSIREGVALGLSRVKGSILKLVSELTTEDA